MYTVSDIFISTLLLSHSTPPPPPPLQPPSSSFHPHPHPHHHSSSLSIPSSSLFIPISQRTTPHHIEPHHIFIPPPQHSTAHTPHHTTPHHTTHSTAQHTHHTPPLQRKRKRKRKRRKRFKGGSDLCVYARVQEVKFQNGIERDGTEWGGTERKRWNGLLNRVGIDMETASAGVLF